MINRREFLRTTLLAPALAKLQPRAGRLVRIVPFGSPGAPTTPLNRLLGAGLDARLFTDLSTLQTDRLLTPVDQFFVRTATPQTLPSSATWKLNLAGLIERPQSLDMPALEEAGRASGRYLIECAGNADPDNYGLISVADWEGIPIASVLERLKPTTGSYRVLVSGFDQVNTPQQTSRTSLPGASWVFTRDELQHALLATRMNGAPLPAAHGAPVRLIVPGWYGCACVKWVDRLELVADAAPATSQMLEFAARTHQPFDVSAVERSLRSAALESTGSQPSLKARDYIPAIIDTAAVPVRIEQWEVGGNTEYRVIGIIWGGQKATNALAIRFRASEPWQPVEHCPLPESTLAWSLWTHTWRPAERGTYEIVLKATDPSIRTRRLDLFYYVRKVTIEAV